MCFWGRVIVTLLALGFGEATRDGELLLEDGERGRGEFLIACKKGE